MYAGLNDSYEWNQLNHGNAITKRVQDVLSEGEIVTVDRMPTAFLQIRNKIKSPLMTQIMNRIEQGRIIMVYSSKHKIPVYLPFIITQPKPNTYQGVVFLNVAEAEDGDGEIFVNARKLKVSLESCLMSLCIRELGESPKLRSTALVRSGSKIYATMVTECINRRHGIKMDVNIYNSALYLVSNYYIGTMLGFRNSMDHDAMRNYCLYNCRNADVLYMDKIVTQFEEKDFVNIATFIGKFKEVPEFQSRIGKLTLTNFLESYINMYNASALLGLEVFNYFLYNIISVNDATYANNYPLLKNYVGDDGKKIYADLVVMVSNLD